jgi:Fic family protein
MGYIYEASDWPEFRWRATELEGVLAEVSFRLGRFLGRLEDIGFALRGEAGVEAVSKEIVASAGIEGETLNRADVRSSVARRMEVALREGERGGTRESEARAEMMLDATRNWAKPLTKERLAAWHAALFPTGWSGLRRIRVGEYRTDAEGPMQVVSRHGVGERVHFEAPAAERVEGEMEEFFRWVNGVEKAKSGCLETGAESGMGGGLIRAALAHLRFLTIHPFEDGNGRLARAVTEWVLARGERSGMRFYSMSARIQKEKEDYYRELETAQRGTMDATRWVKWFVECHGRAVSDAEEQLQKIFRKAGFWRRYAESGFNAHQREMLNRLLNGFEGHLTTSKWAKICKVSQDTATREINALVEEGVLARRGEGRGTHYELTLGEERESGER